MAGQLSATERSGSLAAARLIPRGHWRSLAACRSVDPDVFFPVSAFGLSSGQVSAARAICAGCQVRRECLAFALGTRQAHGVWGGLTEQERCRAARAGARGIGDTPSAGRVSTSSTARDWSA